MSGLPRSYKIPYLGFEIVAHGQNYGEEADVFALCATLFHAATGHHPFGSDVYEILQRVAMQQPSAYGGSAALGALLARGMSPYTSERPTAPELVQELEKLH